MSTTSRKLAREKNVSGTSKQSRTSSQGRVSSHVGQSVSSSKNNKKLSPSSSVTSQKRTTSPARSRVGVSTSQFFPDKSIYSNALKASGKTLTDQATTTASTVKKAPLKVHTPVVKVAKPSLAAVKKEMREKLMQTKPSNSNRDNVPERPRTATLKRPSIVNTNVAGPEVKKISSHTSITKNLATEEVKPTDGDDYEEDFDSYASDFEEYRSQGDDTSSESVDISTDGEETSSTNASDLNPDYIHPPSSGGVLTRRTGSAEEERKLDSGNFDLPAEETKHVQVLDRIKENDPVHLLSSLSDEGFEEAKTSLQFVNFTEARKQRQSARKQSMASRRGKELMSMIRLDQQNFTLFDLPAQSYDEFITAFGNINSVQIASQTGYDLLEEAIQTESIRMVNKWTQFPIDNITFDKGTNPLQYRADLRGVGGDNLEVNVAELKAYVGHFNEYNLARFLINQERVFSELLKENRRDMMEMTPGKFPFSKGYFELNTSDFPPTTLICFSGSKRNPKLITAHAKDADFRFHAFVWPLLKPTFPEDTFTAFGDITDLTFSVDNDKLIFGGFQDGCVAVWDLLEDTPNHYVRPPSFLSKMDHGHVEPIVRVICFHNIMSHDLQIATLDEGGRIIIWGLILRRSRHGSNRVSLVQNLSINLHRDHVDTNLLCIDLCLNRLDPNHVYISTNYGWILHSLITGARTTPRRYNTGLTDPVNILEACPHNANYFIAGSSGGALLLFSRHFEKPLMTISNQDNNAAIVNVQWSFNRPCIFYTQDSSNNIHLWDMSASDLFPTFSIHHEEKMKRMRLVPMHTDTSYLGIVTRDGIVHLHLLNQEHGMQTLDTYNNELRKLNSYLARL